MNERIKFLRHTLGLTQQKFAERLGIKGNAISQYESGRNAPIDAVISLICREFNVNEQWIRTGEGEVFIATEDAAVSNLCREVQASPLEECILRAYFRIPSEIRDAFMHRLIEEVQAEYNLEVPVQDSAINSKTETWSSGESERAQWEREADELAADVREQYLQEKIAEAESSALRPDTGATGKMA